MMRARMAGKLKGIAVLTHTHGIPRVRVAWLDAEPEFSWEYNASTSAGIEASNGPKPPASFTGCYVATKQQREELDGAEQVNGERPAESLTADGDADPTETREWLDSLQGVLQIAGPTRARFLLTQLRDKAIRTGVEIPFTA